MSNSNQAARWNSLPIGSGEDVGAWAMVMFILWEVIPTMLSLMTIARRQGSGGRGGAVPSYGAFHHIASGGSATRPIAISDDGRDSFDDLEDVDAAKRWLEGGNLFDDDRRYDSLPSDSIFDDVRGQRSSLGTTPGVGTPLGMGVGEAWSSPGSGSAGNSIFHVPHTVGRLKPTNPGAGTVAPSTSYRSSNLRSSPGPTSVNYAQSEVV